MREWRLRWLSSGLGSPVVERLNVRLMTGILSVEQISHNCFSVIAVYLSVDEWMHVNDSGESSCGVKSTC